MAAPIIVSTPAAAMSAPQFFAYSQMQALPTATRIASKVVPFIGSMVGGRAVNEASQALTDKTFGENVYDTVSQVFPESVKNKTPLRFLKRMGDSLFIRQRPCW